VAAQEQIETPIRREFDTAESEIGKWFSVSCGEDEAVSMGNSKVGEKSCLWSWGREKGE